MPFAINVRIFLSFLVLSLVPLLAPTALGTLQPHLTDHVRHAHIAHAALSVGPRIFSEPFAAIATDYPYPSFDWREVPYLYPPGAVLFYLPAVWLGTTVSWPMHHYAVAIILYLLFAAHLSLYACLRVTGLDWLRSLLCWLVLMRLALNGQYDVAWIGCAAMAFARIRAYRYASTIRWIVLAGLLHYRAVVLIPLGVYALLRTKKSDWPTHLFAVISGVVCVAAFVVMAHTIPHDLPPSPWRWLAIPLSAATAYVLREDRVAAGTVAIACLFAMIDIPHWWHASLMLPAVLSTRHTVAVVWYVAMQLAVWHGSNPLWLFRDLEVITTTNRAFESKVQTG